MPSLTTLYRMLPAFTRTFASLSGCSFYYEAKAEEMIERQINGYVGICCWFVLIAARSHASSEAGAFSNSRRHAR